MNKAVTDGIDFMPPPFSGGLDVWSSADGVPGNATYDGATNAAFVPADSDFGGALELVKTSGKQKLRYMGETPIIPGCYVRVRARVKAVSGALPNVRIAAWAGGAGGVHVSGLIETSVATTLTDYGQVVEVSAIIGTGNRTGVDMPWGLEPLYAHVGLDLTGPNGGTVRIDDLIVEDATEVFHRKLMDWVDVRDFGALGNGTSDDSAAFAAADAAAEGREVLVSEGVYYLNNNVTFTNPVRFTGTITMPDNRRLSLTKNFDLPSYIEAFGDELVAFRKAVQALFNFTDHDSLDMGGRKVDISEPIDIQEAIDNQNSFTIRRVIRNGQISANASTSWNDTVVTSQATYSTSNPTRLSGVTNIANVPQGALVTGSGVGREVYVRSVNVGAKTLELSAPLYDAAGTQNFTFRRFKYLVDFAGMEQVDKFAFADMEFQCNGYCSAIMLPEGGLNFAIRDCYINKPKDRGITSIGGACQGLSLDRNQLLSNEQADDVADRTTIACNINSNDAKIRDNRAVRFKHFLVMGAGNYLISNNHWFQGDSVSGGVRSAGLVLTTANVTTTINSNYIDNNFIEWTNEHDAEPDVSGFSFSALTISNNLFYSINAASWFAYVVIKPYGAGHYIQGLQVTNNVFRAVNATLDRVDKVDDTFAPLDHSRHRNVTFSGNAYNSISQMTVSPVMLEYNQSTSSTVWTLDFADWMPFGAYARNVQSVVKENNISGSNGTMPYVRVEKGSSKAEVELVWPNACTGRVQVTARMDNPN